MTSVEPYATGLLDVGDGHRVYWECCGNPDGKPALYLHGGPGSGCSAGSRALFDLRKHNAVLMDQRGCGRSEPLVGDSPADLVANTTAYLISDIEKLREHLSISQWTVLGLSWGSTLALAYAEAYPERIEGLVLALVTTTSRREVLWLTQDVGRIFPAEWNRFASFIPEHLVAVPLVDAYATLLYDHDPATQMAAAREWCAWEDAHVSLAPGWRPNPRFEDPDFRLRFARLVTHYWRNGAFLAEDQLIHNAAALNGIVGILICGRYDVSSPLEAAWRLSKVWATSRLRVLPHAGHDGAGLLEAITEGFAFTANAR
jgi:proline iminopeptidase